MAGGEEEGEVAALREALRRQAAAVEELQAELEEERQAAASGADEALAMILRLQAEKAAERMEAEQFRRVAEERIQHDEDTLAFLKAVVFHQEMEISSLNRRLLAVHAAGEGSDDPLSPAGDLPWLRRLAKNGASARRNASLPAARLEELCSELDVAGAGAGGADVSYPCKNLAGDRRPARTVSDIGEVIGRDKDWAAQPAPRLLRSASHRLRRAPSYARCAARASPEIIAEEDEKSCSCKSGATLEAGDVEQIKAAVQALEAELVKLRHSAASTGDAHSRLLAEIRAKLDGAMPPPQTKLHGGGHGSPRNAPAKTTMEEGSSSRGRRSSSSDELLLMNHFIEVCGLAISALLVRPLVRVAASMSVLRGLLILVLAAAIRKVLISS
ncbi:hypothetical protein ACP4OV_027871 [Aristida adscensionis]